MADALYQPDYLLQGDRFVGGLALAVENGLIKGVVDAAGLSTTRLKKCAMLPGQINAHSHAFQRLIRGRTEFRAPTAANDDFWSWRQQMYRVAEALEPEDLFVASRQAFLEMALAGITSVGEFHYLHRGRSGRPYARRNELAEQVIRAAREVGLRIVLLRAVYGRAGHRLELSPAQRRFVDGSAEEALAAVEELSTTFPGDPLISVGLAPHSVRAVPKSWLQAFTWRRDLPVHMHVAEQPAEVAACLGEHGRRPVELLEELGLLGEAFTAVHAIHLSETEIEILARHRTCVCACPTTERNLGDGIVPADRLVEKGVPVALGSDSQTVIDLLQEARLAEEHLRLEHRRRAILGVDQVFRMQTVNGALSLRIRGGALQPGLPADFFTVALDHPSLSGAEPSNLLAAIIFGAEKSAVRDVAVHGNWIVRDGHHTLEEASGRQFAKLAQRVFA